MTAFPRTRSVSTFLVVSSVALGLGLSLATSRAAIDLASNYGGIWTNGSNGGSGFNPWGLIATGNATFDIANSTAGAGNVNSSGVAFQLFASGSNVAEAIRSFGGGANLAIGEIFSFDLSVNYRNGNKGFDLRNDGTTLFNFNVGGDNYFFGGVDLGAQGWGYVGDGVYSFEFEILTATTMRAEITRTSAFDTTRNYEIASVSIASPVNNFKFYSTGTDASPTPENSLYFNNLSVVPEPSTWALVAAGLIGIIVRQRKSQNSENN